MLNNQEKTALVELIKSFIDNSVKIKKKNSSASQKKLFGIYRNTSIKTSFGISGTFANVPWIAFLAHNQQVRDGIYPVILYITNKDSNNFEVCYGVSQAFYPDKDWPINIVKEKQNSNSGKFPRSFLSSAFTINSVKDFEEQEDQILSALNQVINDFHKIF